MLLPPCRAQQPKLVGEKIIYSHMLTNYACEWVGTLLALASMACLLLVMSIILGFKQRTGFLIILATLSILEWIYCFAIATSLPIGASSSFNLCQFQAFITYTIGISVSVWGMVMTTIVFYVVYKTSHVDIYRIYPLCFMVSVGLPMILSFVAEAYHIFGEREQITFWCSVKTNTKIALTFGYMHNAIIVVSIVYDFTILGIILYMVNRNKRKMSSSVFNIHKVAAVSATESLAMRLMYYPLIQAILRSGALINEFATASERKGDGLELLHSICSASSGIGFMFIFFAVQPGAYAIFRQRLCDLLTLLGLAGPPEPRDSKSIGLLSAEHGPNIRRNNYKNINNNKAVESSACAYDHEHTPLAGPNQLSLSNPSHLNSTSNPLQSTSQSPRTNSTGGAIFVHSGEGGPGTPATLNLNEQLTMMSSAASVTLFARNADEDTLREMIDLHKLHLRNQAQGGNL